MEACAHISSISSKLIPEPIFLCNANSNHLILSFITALEGLATQSKAQMKLNFIEVETAIKMKLCATLEQLNQRRNRTERASHFCRGLYRGVGGNGLFYTIPANTNESINWLTGTL